MTWKVEVKDEGGCGTGTHVRVLPSAESAIRHLAVVLGETWAGAWSLTAPGVHLSGTNRKD